MGETLGEAVFSTGMTGYQETLTDPSYHRQIVVATAPQIGNTGWNDEDNEGAQIWVAGYAVRDPSRRVSNWRATGSLQEELERQGVVGIAGIDTRAVVRHLRTRGSMKAGIFSGEALADPADMLAKVTAQPSMLGADLASEVSTPTATSSNPTASRASRSPPSTWASRRTPRACSRSAASGCMWCRRAARSTTCAS